MHKVHKVHKLPVDQTASCPYQASSQTTTYDPDRLLVSVSGGQSQAAWLETKPTEQLRQLGETSFPSLPICLITRYIIQLNNVTKC